MEQGANSMDAVSLSVVAVGTVLGLLVIAQAWLLWRLTRVLASAARVEERVGHFADALSLLTETTESGFRAMADELGRRRVDVPDFLQHKAATARVNAAARRGRSVTEIAATEEVSEGEVRLRLHLGGQAGQPARVARPAKPAGNKSVTLAKTASLAKTAAARTRRARTESVDEMRA
jgi:hypothetical protein